MVNLLEVPATTRGQLADRMRASRPELKFFWMPFFVLKRPRAGSRSLLQKIMKPGKPALDVYAAFKFGALRPGDRATRDRRGAGRHEGLSPTRAGRAAQRAASCVRVYAVSASYPSGLMWLPSSRV